MNAGGKSARAEILGRIGASLGRGSGPQERRAGVEARLAAPPPPLIPALAPTGSGGRIEHFRSRAEATSASTARINRWQELPGAVATYLDDRDLSGPIKAQPRPPFTDLDWRAFEVAFGPADAVDQTGLVLADAGAAETGTLFLMSGAEAPTALNFLPETLIAVLPVAVLAGDYEAAWAICRETAGNQFPPRTVNWISGPSRSADIEQQVQMGVHGPRNLHIILVDTDGA
ncbi:MAG: lactate utilization protein [Rhodospirillales bacterium]|mgnify:CR=1 FL=1|nr:lactate utilization protein [Rhodospirillales bacterium]MDP6642586.1 lactate utilization protein [Rhodospirillales bacterium]